jgi:predicted SnoaL-like aldol condensation-catalyzing enzyme
MKKIILMGLLLSFKTFGEGIDQDVHIKENYKEIVSKFYETAFNEHKPRKAAKLYIGKRYIQHNPHAPDGVRSFIEFFEGYYKSAVHKKAHVIIKRVIAEGDLVVVHTHSKGFPEDRGRAVVDIFRLENNKIVEHWDVMQEIPEKMAHQNTMF